MKPKPRPEILMVEFFSRGGLYHYALQLALALARQGHTITLLTARHPEIVPAEHAPGFGFAPRLWTWNPRQSGGRPALGRRVIHAARYVVMWLQILWWALRLRPVALLFGDFEHRCDAWFCALLLAAGSTVADVCHNVISFDRHSDSRLLRQERWRDRLLGRLDCVFAHGVVLADQLRRRTGRQAVAIPHGAGELCMRAAGPDPDLRARLQLPPPTPVALMFGTLTKYKGIEWLLDALAAVPPAVRPYLVIAGFPAADAKLEAWQARGGRLGLDASVRWVPEYVPWPQVAWYFRLASFIVLPYYQASQSGVAHLALSFGRALIVSAAGALPDVVTPGINGLVVPVRDIAALAQAIERLSADGKLCQAMGRQGAAMAVHRHDWDEIARLVGRELTAKRNGAGAPRKRPPAQPLARR